MMPCKVLHDHEEKKNVGAGVTAQVKLLLGTPLTISVGAPVPIPTTPLSIQFPAHHAGRQQEMPTAQAILPPI